MTAVIELDFQGTEGSLHVRARNAEALYFIDQDSVVRIMPKAGNTYPVPTPGVETQRGIEALHTASSLSFFGEDQDGAQVYRVRWGSAEGLLASRSDLEWLLV